MKLIVWAPGLMGTKLLRRAAAPQPLIWPPHPDAEGGLSDRTGAQLKADLRAGTIIDQVCLCEVYEPLDELFRDAGVSDWDPAAPAPLARLPFGFDWRKSIASQAADLANRLDQISPDEIVLVGHSMGALLLRYLIEAVAFQGRPFRAAVTLLFSINGPHGGAPLAVTRALGFTKTEHIVWADEKDLLAAPGLSGAYELLTDPAGHPSLFDGATPIDYFNGAVITHFGLGAANMASAQQLRADLAAGQKPQGCRYVAVASFAGQTKTDPTTVEAMVFQSGKWTLTEAPGDGTVPHWSAVAMAADASVEIPGTHLGVINTTAFATAFLREVLPERAVAMAALAPEPTISLQPLSFEVPAEDRLPVAVVREGVADVTRAVLVWQRVDAVDRTSGPRALTIERASSRTELTIPDGAAPVMYVTAPARAGLYRLSMISPEGGRPVGRRRGKTLINVRRRDERRPEVTIPPKS